MFVGQTSRCTPTINASNIFDVWNTYIDGFRQERSTKAPFGSIVQLQQNWRHDMRFSLGKPGFEAQHSHTPIYPRRLRLPNNIAPSVTVPQNLEKPWPRHSIEGRREPSLLLPVVTKYGWNLTPSWPRSVTSRDRVFAGDRPAGNA